MQVQLHNFLILKRFFYQKISVGSPNRVFFPDKAITSSLKNQARTPFSSKTFWLEASRSVFFGAITFLYGFVRIERRFLPPCGTTKPCNEKNSFTPQHKKKEDGETAFYCHFSVFLLSPGIGFSRCRQLDHWAMTPRISFSRLPASL